MIVSLNNWFVFIIEVEFVLFELGIEILYVNARNVSV